MKKLYFIVLIVILILFTGCTSGVSIQENKTFKPTSSKVNNIQKSWLDVSNYICYYGNDLDVNILSNFDVAIIYPNVLFDNPNSKDLIKQLQDKGTYVIVYLTVGEDDKLSIGDGLGDNGYASYYIYENGYPKQNDNWGTYFVDAGNPAWQSKVIKEAENILQYDVDGLFLDNLDTVDIDSKILPGMISLMKSLDSTFPNKLFVINRGFTVLPFISQYIDGLMFESFNTTYDFETKKVVNLSEKTTQYNINVAQNIINTTRQYKYFPVFTLDYVNKSDINYKPQYYYNRSWQFDFIPYVTYDFSLATPFIPVDADGNFLTPTSNRGEMVLKDESKEKYSSLYSHYSWYFR